MAESNSDKIGRLRRGRDLYKQQRDELLAAIEEHRKVTPRPLNEDERALYRAAERVRKGSNG